MDQQVDNLTNTEFKLGYWIFEHKDLFKKILTWILVVVVIVFWGYSLVKWVQVLATNKSHNDMLLNLSQNNVAHITASSGSRPIELDVLKVKAVKNGNSYDLVAQINNPNIKWGGKSFHYSFMSGQEMVAEGDSFILPFEEKYVAAYDVKLPSSNSDITLETSSVSWQRVKDFKDFIRPDFLVSNYRVDDLGELSVNSVQGTRLSFDILNNSPYSFWRVDLTIILSSGGEVAAVANKPFRVFNAGDKQTVEVSWPYSIPFVSGLVVKADVNTLSSDVIKTSLNHFDLRLVENK